MEESTRGRGRPRGRPARGARATRGGRGAARGAAAAASEPEPTPTPAVDTAMADAPPAEAFPSLAAASEASTSQTNTAAPPLPTENATPAAEPSRSASPAVRGASSTRASAARGAPRGGRFLPRAIRRSALDREAIARDVQLKMEDQERQNARLKMRGRGGRGGRRARGGPVNFGAVIRGGGGGFGSNIVTATGGRGECFLTDGALYSEFLTIFRWWIWQFWCCRGLRIYRCSRSGWWRRWWRPGIHLPQGHEDRRSIPVRQHIKSYRPTNEHGQFRREGSPAT